MTDEEAIYFAHSLLSKDDFADAAAVLPLPSNMFALRT